MRWTGPGRGRARFRRASFTSLRALKAPRGWALHDLVFGSMARGTARRGSDADIAVVGASGAQLPDAVRAARAALGLTADVMPREDVAEPVRQEDRRDGIAHGEAFGPLGPG